VNTRPGRGPCPLSGDDPEVGRGEGQAGPLGAARSLASPTFGKLWLSYLLPVGAHCLTGATDAGWSRLGIRGVASTLWASPNGNGWQTCLSVKPSRKMGVSLPRFSPLVAFGGLSAP
jgi:hypothetical protein